MVILQNHQLAESFQLLVEKDPVVAFLSHSTKGSASHADVDKVVEAVKIAKEQYRIRSKDGRYRQSQEYAAKAQKKLHDYKCKLVVNGTL